MGTISHAEAKAFYDRLGSRQDWQGFYENPALNELIVHGRFGAATAVCEIGCGTGKLAARLLADHLPPTARYLGLDVSETMVALAGARLAPWSERARLVRSDGAPAIPAPDGGIDRVVASYVLDLLSEADIRALLAEARRVLAPGGLLCNVGLTFGRGPVERAVCAAWQAIHRWRPVLLGGCRPLVLVDRLEPAAWSVEHRTVICPFAVCSEVVVAAAKGWDSHQGAG